MNWIRNRIRPKIKTNTPKDVPDNLWIACPKCKRMIFHKELQEVNFVCSECGHHFPLVPIQRLDMIFDDATYSVLQLPKVKEDPLHFTDIKKYTERLKEARKKTDQSDAIIIAFGKIDGRDCVVGVMNFEFMGGSMGMAVGEAILSAVNLSILQQAPLILFTASGGARMQEGILSLMQMPRTTLALKMLADKKIPYICVLTNPTAGGVTASFAMLGDVMISEPGATVAFAGRRVIEQTVRQKLPDDFQTAEYLLTHGQVDMVIPRSELRKCLIQILNLFC